MGESIQKALSYKKSFVVSQGGCKRFQYRDCSESPLRNTSENKSFI